MKLRKSSPGRAALTVVAIAIAAVWLIPLIWMVLASLKPVGTPVTVLKELLSPPFTALNYQKVTGSPIWSWMFNSVLVASITTFGVIVIDSLAAYALSRIHFPGSKLLFWVVLAGLMIPVEAELIPLYQIIVEMNLINTYAALIFPGLAAPFGVFVLKQFFDGIPNELVEAAKIDGAGPCRIYYNIFLPLSRSSLIAVAIFTFLGSWNNYIWPFLAITKEKMMTVPIGLPMFQSIQGTDIIMPMAANVLASLPAILLFMVFQRHIIKGISMTGIKG